MVKWHIEIDIGLEEPVRISVSARLTKDEARLAAVKAVQRDYPDVTDENITSISKYGPLGAFHDAQDDSDNNGERSGGDAPDARVSEAT